MISGLVLKYRKNAGVGMAKKLSSLSKSGKAVYSDSARSIATFSQDLRLSKLVFIPKTNDYTLSKFAALAA